MSPPGEDSRPPSRENRGAGHNPTAPSLTLEARADLQLRIAWLTVHADRLFEVGGGQLSAQLLDLLEVGAVQGWPR